jgi:hypothetical protein
MQSLSPHFRGAPGVKAGMERKADMGMWMAAAQGTAALPSEAILDAAAYLRAAARALPAAQPGLPGDMRGRMLALLLHLLGHVLPTPPVCLSTSALSVVFWPVS